MQRDEQFLRYRPSQLAAASLILALNLSESTFAKQIGMTPKPDSYEEKGLTFEQTINLLFTARNRLSIILRYGEMAEWLKAPVLKTGIRL